MTEHLLSSNDHVDKRLMLVAEEARLSEENKKLNDSIKELNRQLEEKQMPCMLTEGQINKIE